MQELKITTSAYNLEAAITAIYELTEGLVHGVFESSIEGVLNANEKLSPSDNSQCWIAEHYEALAGAVRLIAITTDMISSAIVNNEVVIMPVKEGKQCQS